MRIGRWRAIRLAEAVKVAARAHQSMIWARQRQSNMLRSTLREYYPAALEAFVDLDAAEALAVLERAPTPDQGRRLSRSAIAAILRRAGRQRRIDERTLEIQAALRSPPTPSPTADQIGVRRHRGRHRRGARRANRQIGRSKPNWPTVLASTRTPGSSVPCQD